MKKVEHEININPLDSINRSNKKKVRMNSEDGEYRDEFFIKYDDKILNDNKHLDRLVDSISKKTFHNNSIKTFNPIQPFNPMNDTKSDKEVEKFQRISPKDLNEKQMLILSSSFKIIPLVIQPLKGFYYDKFDYIGEDQCLSLYLIGINYKVDEMAIIQYFTDNKFEIKTIINNPFEERGIVRVVLKKSDIFFNFLQNNLQNYLLINGCKILYIQCPFGQRANPENLYDKHQVAIKIEGNSFFDNNDLAEFIVSNFGELFEINVIDSELWVVTFFSTLSVELCLEYGDMKFDDMSLKFSRYHCPVGFSGSYFSYQIPKLPDRPSIPYNIPSTYIPEIKTLLSVREMWNYFRLEDISYKRMSVDHFLNEISRNRSIFEAEEKKNTHAPEKEIHVNVNNISENIIKQEKTQKNDSIDKPKKTQNQSFKKFDYDFGDFFDAEGIIS
jgi:hypothetical protein